MLKLKLGLKGKLIQSNISLTFIAACFLILSMMVFMWLKVNTSNLVNINIPFNQTTETLKTNVNKSLAALRGWINLPDETFIEERNTAWDKKIIPSIEKLKNLTHIINDAKLTNEVNQLITQIWNLYSWQWRIEDVAQAPGNFPKQSFYLLNIKPLYLSIGNRVDALIYQSQDTINEDITISLKSLYLASYSNVTRYLVTDDDFAVSEARTNLKNLNNKLNPMQFDDENLQEAKQELMGQVNIAYQQLTQLQKQGNPIATDMLGKYAVPIARDIEKKLDAVITIEKRKLDGLINKVGTIADFIPIALSILLVLLIMTSVYMANKNSNKILEPLLLLIGATKELAKGRLNNDIPITTKDELAQLTNSFNEMRRNIHYADLKTRGIIDTANNPILTIDTKGIILSVNKATTEVYQYSEQELLGQNVAILMPEPHKSRHNQYLENYAKTAIRKIIGKERNVISISKTGEEIPAQLFVGEINLGGKIIFSGILRDLREQIKQEKAITCANARLEKENLNRKAMSDVDNILRPLEGQSQFAESILAYLAKQFNSILCCFYAIDSTEKKIQALSGVGFNLSNKKDVDWNHSLLQQCMASKKKIELTDFPKAHIKLSTYLGESYPKYLLLIPLVYQDNVLGIVELCRNTKFSEDEEALLDVLIENISLSYSLIVAKEKMKKLYKDSETKRIRLLQQEEELRSSNEELEMQTQAIKQSEEELRSTNEELTQQLSFIAEQKEQIKQKSEQLEKSGKYKSEFLANMSHELRTPLNSLLILAQGFIANREKNLSDEQLEEAKIIYESGSDLLALINDILDISKVESGKLDIIIDEVNLSDIRMALYKQFYPIANAKKIDLNMFEVESLTFTTFYCDQLRLLQILKNLLSNAFKFTHSGSVALSCSFNESNIEFSITDTGIGIPKNKQELIFSEFQQADGSTSREYGGTGLGLAISKRLAMLLGGDITLKSIEQQGSTFKLVLPIHSPKTIKVGYEGKSSEDKLMSDSITLDEKGELNNPCFDDREKISGYCDCLLIIDDDLTFNKSIAKISRSKGHNVLQSLSGLEGLQLAKKYLPKGIILDLGLPDISGEEVLQQLKHDKATNDIPVYIISAQDKSSSLLKNGAVNFLQKPVSLEDIESLVKILDGRDNQCILIVEDDLVSQKGIKKLFLEKGVANVDFANSGKEALKAFNDNDNDYGCLVIDLGLPDQSGFDLIKVLAESEKHLPPIVVYTARDLLPDEHKFIKQYTNSIVIKGEKAHERLFDEIFLFLYHVDTKNKKSSAITTSSVVDRQESFTDKTLLLVDDDLRNVFALSRALQHEGLKVVIADNGQLALDKLNETDSFDLVLMDMMMPVMDGYEAIHLIRQHKRYADIPIIALTAKATKQDKEKCISAGASDYMSKPIDVKKLLELIRVWITQERNHGE